MHACSERFVYMGTLRQDTSGSHKNVILALHHPATTNAVLVKASQMQKLLDDKTSATPELTQCRQAFVQSPTTNAMTAAELKQVLNKKARRRPLQTAPEARPLAVGDRVEVYWARDRQWFPATVEECFEGGVQLVKLQYDDGDEEEVDMHHETWRHPKPAQGALPLQDQPTVDVCCICNEPGDGALMLLCEESSCTVVSHLKCTGFSKVPRKAWYCVEHKPEAVPSKKQRIHPSAPIHQHSDTDNTDNTEGIALGELLTSGAVGEAQPFDTEAFMEDMGAMLQGALEAPSAMSAAVNAMSETVTSKLSNMEQAINSLSTAVGGLSQGLLPLQELGSMNSALQQLLPITQQTSASNTAPPPTLPTTGSAFPGPTTVQPPIASCSGNVFPNVPNALPQAAPHPQGMAPPPSTHWQFYAGMAYHAGKAAEQRRMQQQAADASTTEWFHLL